MLVFIRDKGPSEYYKNSLIVYDNGRVYYKVSGNNGLGTHKCRAIEIYNPNLTTHTYSMLEVQKVC